MLASSSSLFFPRLEVPLMGWAINLDASFFKNRSGDAEIRYFSLDLKRPENGIGESCMSLKKLIIGSSFSKEAWYAMQ